MNHLFNSLVSSAGQLFSKLALPLFFLCLCWCQSSPVLAQQVVPTNGIVYVTQYGGGNGSSWDNPTSNLQAAIDAKGVREVHVAVGKYERFGRSFTMRNNVAIYGGFDPGKGIISKEDRILPADLPSGGNSTRSPGSVLSGAINRVINNSFTEDNPLTANAVLDGFTISGGGNVSDGGGIYNYYASPTLRNVVIMGNSAHNYGGGMYNYQSNSVLTNVLVSENKVNHLDNPSNEELRGGGVYNESSSIVMTNVVIKGNTVSKSGFQAFGGGMYNSSSSPILTEVIISGNTATTSGGGMCNTSSSPILTEVIISGNTATTSGGGMSNSYSSSPVLRNVTIRGNGAEYGGGVFNTTTSSSLLMNVTISENTAFWGGGMCNFYSASPVLRNVTISGNTASRDGGGMFSRHSSSPKLTNVTISGNTAVRGGGMYNRDSSSSLLTNVTISGNTASDQGGGIYNVSSSSPKLFNSIVWGNTGGSSPVIFGNIASNSSHNLIAGGHSSNISGIQTDLLAKDIFEQYVLATEGSPGTAGDYRLKNSPTNPGINAGDNTHYPDLDQGAEDLAGLPRLSGCHIDLGAYEVQGQRCIKPDANGILYVKQGATGDGSSWDSALGEVREALKWAQENKADFTATSPLQIWVAKGKYTPSADASDRDATFQLVNHVELYGGFVGGETSLEARDWQANATILSGDIDGNDTGTDGINIDADQIKGNNSYTVVMGSGTDNSAVLDGFTLTGGNADTRIGLHGSPTLSGGGFFNRDGSPTLENLTISGNSASYGGGMSNHNSSPVLTNVTIRGNTASTQGGGMYNYNSSSPVLTNVTISGNSASYGGGINNHDSSSPVLTNVTITGNSAVWYGGGMFNQNSSPVLTNVTISGNSASYGGGINNHDSSSRPKLFNSIVWGNTGVSSPTIHGNIASNSSHNLIAGGHSSNISGVPTDLLAKDIFEQYVLVTEGSPGTAGDYRLKAGSPAINRGNNQWYTDTDKGNGDLENDLDLEGSPRLAGGTIDLGAYESPYEDIVSVADLDDISIDFGTALGTVPLPADFSVQATLTDGSTPNVALDTDTDNWILVDPVSGSYGGDAAGTYTFEVPILPVDPDATPWFSNVKQLKATLKIIVQKGTWTGLTFEDKAETYDGTAKSIVLAGLPDPLPDGVTVSYTVDGDPGNTAVDAGSYAIIGRIAGGDNYEDWTEAATLTIAAMPLTVTANADQYKVYGDADPVLTYTHSGLADGDTETAVFTGALSRTAGEDVGNYAISLGDLSAGDNYDITLVPADFTITAAQLTVTADADQMKVYGQSDPIFTYDVTGYQLNDDETILSGTLSREVGEEVGTYRILQGDLAAGNNYSITFVSDEFEITLATITGITFTGGSFVYDGSSKSLAISGDLPEGVTVAYTGNAQTDAGEYTVTATMDGGNNYRGLVLSAKLEVTKASLVDIITFTDGSFVYDGSSKSLAISGDLPDGVTVAYAGNAQTDAGEYTVTATIDGGNNYGSLVLSAKLEVTKASLVDIITFDGGRVVYDGRSKSLALSGDLPDGVTVAYAGNAQTDAGEYTVTATVDGGNNYENLVLTAVLEITRASLSDVLAFEDSRVVYDGSSKSLAISGDLPEGVTVAYTGNAQTDAGEYTVTATIDGGNNYENLVLSAELEVIPAVLEVIADNHAKLLGSDDPELTYSVDGLLAGELAENVVSGSLIRIGGEAEGNYSIARGSLSTTSNYRLVFNQGALSIVRGVQLAEPVPSSLFISWEEHPPLTLHIRNTWESAYQPGDEFVLELENGPGFEITGVEGNDFEIHQNGSQRVLRLINGWEISAIKNIEIQLVGDGRYAGPSSLSVSVRNPRNEGVIVDDARTLDIFVEDGSYTIIAPNVFTPNGDGINDAFVFEGLELHDRAELTVLNRFGDQVYIDLDYKNDWTAPHVNDGTYFYVLQAWRYDHIQQKTVKSFFRGSVLIKRN